MAKRKIAIKSLTDKIRLANTPPPIDGDKLGLSRIRQFSEPTLLFFSSYHNSPLVYLLRAELYHISMIKIKYGAEKCL